MGRKQDAVDDTDNTAIGVIDKKECLDGAHVRLGRVGASHEVDYQQRAADGEEAVKNGGEGDTEDGQDEVLLVRAILLL